MLTSVSPTVGLLHKVARNVFLSLVLMSSAKTSPAELMMTLLFDPAEDCFQPYRGAMVVCWLSAEYWVSNQDMTYL